MFCPQCGSTQDQGVFCTSCGRPLGEVPVQTRRMPDTLSDPERYGMQTRDAETGTVDLVPALSPASSLAEPAATAVSTVPDPYGMHRSTHVSVNVAGPQIICQDKSGPGLLPRGIWFVFIGWWAGWFWITAAAVLNWTIVGLPLGILMMNAVPKVMTLKSRDTRLNLAANADGTYTLTRQHLAQHPFWARALFFVFIGSWLSLVWAWTAWAIGLFIVTLPVSFWMFDRVPALTTLARY